MASLKPIHPTPDPTNGDDTPMQPTPVPDVREAGDDPTMVQITDIDGEPALVSAEELEAIVNPGSKLKSEDEAVTYAEKRMWEAVPQAIDTLIDLMVKSNREQTRQTVATQIIDRVLGPTRTGEKQGDTPLDKALKLLLLQPKDDTNNDRTGD